MDPYAKGAYPYKAPETKPEPMSQMQKTQGNIHFAGEYNSEFGCSVHNAYATGERIAIEVVSGLIQAKKPRF